MAFLSLEMIAKTQEIARLYSVRERGRLNTPASSGPL